MLGWVKVELAGYESAGLLVPVPNG